MSNVIQKLGEFMSDFLTAALAEIETIANGSADAEATKAAVASLTAKVNSDEADAAEVKQVVQALVDKLAAAPAPVSTATPTPTPTPTPTDTSSAAA